MADIKSIDDSLSETYEFFENGEEASAETLNRPIKKLIDEINAKVKPIGMAKQNEAGLVKVWLSGTVLNIDTRP